MDHHHLLKSMSQATAIKIKRNINSDIGVLCLTDSYTFNISSRQQKKKKKRKKTKKKHSNTNKRRLFLMAISIHCYSNSSILFVKLLANSMLNISKHSHCRKSVIFSASYKLLLLTFFGLTFRFASSFVLQSYWIDFWAKKVIWVDLAAT